MKLVIVACAIMAFSSTTVSINKPTIMTFDMMTLRANLLSIMTFDIMTRHSA